MTNNTGLNLKNTSNSLSIQLNLNGFSFSIISENGLVLNNYSDTSGNFSYTEQQLLEKVTEVFNSKPELKADFQKIDVVYYNELFTLVPKPLFSEAELKTYINYSVKTLVTDYIAFDELSAGIMNVFIPYVNVNNFLLETLGEFDYHHSSGILINFILDKEKYNFNKKVYLFIGSNQFDIICTHGIDLKLFNSFIYTNYEDILYYLLFCLEQLSLSPDQINIEILNTIPTDLFNMLYTYIRNITQPKLDLNFSDVLLKLAQQKI